MPTIVTDFPFMAYDRAYWLRSICARASVAVWSNFSFIIYMWSRISITMSVHPPLRVLLHIDAEWGEQGEDDIEHLLVVALVQDVVAVGHGIIVN